MPATFENEEIGGITRWSGGAGPQPLGATDAALLADSGGAGPPQQIPAGSWHNDGMHPITFTALEAFPRALELHYAAFPPEFAHWAPASWDGVPSEPFTAIEQICHVRDIEIEGYQVRFRRTLAEDTPLLPSIDSEALARERDYGRADARKCSRNSAPGARRPSRCCGRLAPRISSGPRCSKVTGRCRCAALFTISAATTSSISRVCSGC